MPQPRHVRRSTLARLAAAAFALAACAAGARAAPPALLSQTGLWADPAAHVVRADVLAYAPQYPLWTDGAEKRRWIRLPRGAAIDASRPGAWTFPVGTQLWKEFAFGRRVETRYMERTREGWLYAAYLWDADGREARLAPSAGVPGAAPIRDGVRHDVPGVADCRGCHEARAVPVLGFDALQLSPDRDPLAPHARPPAPGEVDLPALVSRGLLRGLPPALLAHPPRIAARTPRERAVLGYLHGNCASCHGAGSALAGLGLVLQHDLAARAPAEEPALRTTAGAPSRFQVPGLAPGQTRRVAPGAPERSALTYRLRSRSPLAQMPPVGSHLPDEEALALVEAWIREDLREDAAAAPAPVAAQPAPRDHP